MAETLMFDYHRQHGIGNVLCYLLLPPHYLRVMVVEVFFVVNSELISYLSSQKYELPESLTRMVHA